MKKLNDNNLNLSKRKKVFWGSLISIVLIIIIMYSNGFIRTNNINQNSDTGEKNSQNVLSEKEFKQKCEKIDYKTLARKPNKYKGKLLIFTGKVIQVIEPTYGETFDLRILVTKNEYGFWDDTIFATIDISEDDDRILEDDIIKFWGTCEGLYSYKGLLGSKVSLPSVNIKYYELKE